MNVLTCVTVIKSVAFTVTFVHVNAKTVAFQGSTSSAF